MITNTTYKIVNGRIYATITRNAIVDGETITIQPSERKDTTYTKYLPNEGFVCDIDLTPYCQSALSGRISEIYDNSNSEGEDGVNFRVVVHPIAGDSENDYVPYYANCKGDRRTQLLTKLPYLQIAERNGFYNLLLAFYTERGANLEIFSGEDEVGRIEQKGETVQYIDISITNTQSLTIKNKTDNTDISIPIRVVPRGMNTRRLVWRNEVGGVDAWSFEFLRESSFATSSDVFYTSKGYTRTNRISERAHIVETRELDDITASVVAYVIASPEVYLEENDKLVPIDIVTEECRTYSDTELSSIQVAYRLKQREL